MKKLTLLALACILLSVLLLASCGGNLPDDSGTPNSTPDSTTQDSGTADSGTQNNNKTEISIKVTDQLGYPVKDVYLQVCQGDMCFKAPVITGEDGIGKMSLELNGEAIKATILQVKAEGNYVFDKEEAFYFESGASSLEIEISKKATYTVNCKTEGGVAIEGVTIQLYNAENNRLTSAVKTDANGVASFADLTPAEYYVKLLPADAENYTVLNETAEEGKYVFADNATSLDLSLELKAVAY